ncbi:MAG TPA: M42 family metallopeptidase [Saprospiraceae bacterium]|jgi:putative aminopeptidase FrvX|nr:M42 family metallopeptidase [Saprospiraceae bacterium]MCC6689348.1 M42 family metallopeptidase [Saprospiraceae bacterium]HMW75743.1 M42 family metallopeptidase [Saprospiraceae bacterium]HMX86650.1 M42 family metallopeptidase [Saprospiraceae bacterium]HMZ73824.1 M42 family metallopeptidase [Saprospiraceae bacterium]
MVLNTTLLKKICETPGAPGFEHRIRQLIIKEIEPLVDSWYIDNVGNLIALRKGSSDKKLMVTAHMDEISFIVTHIDDDGFIRFHPLGGFDPKTLTAQRVIVHGTKDLIGVMGSKPIHIMKPEERTKAPAITDYYIDMGMSKDDLVKHISIGDPITRERDTIEMGDCINAKSLDNRISVFILIETLKELARTELPCSLYAVFTVQEEVGLRGVSPAAHSIEPDYGINIDTTIAFDTPGAQAWESITHLGQGTAIKIADGSVICDTRMVSFMKYMADKHGIPWQPEILTAGGTDTAGLQRSGKGGSISGAISIPTRHIHSVIEMVHKTDVLNSIRLLKNCITEISNFNWNHK